MACVTNSIKTGVTEFGVLIQPNTPTEQLLMLMNRLDRIMIVTLLGYIVASELYITVNKFRKKKENKALTVVNTVADHQSMSTALCLFYYFSLCR